MEKELHSRTHKASPEDILKEKILSARIKSTPDAPEEKSDESDDNDEFYSESSGYKETWFEKNEYVIIGAIVLIVVIVGCIVWNVLGT